MTKFLIYVCLLILLPFLTDAQSVREFRAVKITNVDSDILYSDEKIASGMDYLASIGINTILMVVWNGSSTTGDCTLYPSAIMDSLFGIPVHPAFSGRDPLKRIIIEAHRNAMEVLPWFEMGFASSYSQEGGHIISRFPDWALKNRDGNLVVKNGFDWMSAINPDVQDFIISLTTEVINKYDVDGIEYSDRIPAMPVEGGYDSVTVAIYREEHNGNAPPDDFRDSDWKRWRADKLTAFCQRVRDSIKARGNHLIFSSSPSIYPWSYEEYLQDSKTWVEEGIADNIIPQLYRYSYSDYVYELNRSLNNFPGYRDIYYAGLLIKSGGYVISPEYLLNALQANRDRNINGEAFFFYEGLRANNNLLGDTLKATFYKERAMVPDRNGMIWRPKPVVIDENHPGNEKSDGWISYETIPGFREGCLYADGSDAAYIDYRVDVPYTAWYGIYVYGISHWNATGKAQFVIYGNAGNDTILIDQRQTGNKGWYKLSDIYLESTTDYRLMQISNAQDREHLLFADAVMLMLDRKRSPEYVVSGVAEEAFSHQGKHQTFRLMPNHPNPFNAQTAIDYWLPAFGHVELSIYNILGQIQITLMNGNQQAGYHTAYWDATHFPSGAYFIRLSAGSHQATAISQTRKIILLK